MKKLNEYILENFKINSEIINHNKEDKYYDKSNYKEAINKLKEEAKKYNCKITFKNHPDGDTGDFTIFIYTPESNRYAVGYDGDWNAKELTFDHCYHQALNWLDEKYNK